VKSILWHPIIHTLYSEDLYYFVLRFTPYTRDSLLGLKERLLEKKGATGICLYEILGDYDVLLRAWLTQTMLAEVYRTLDRYPGLVAHPFFRVRQQKHWAFPRDPDKDLLNKLSSSTAGIKTAQEAARSELDEVIHPYVEAGAAYYGTISDPRFVKFYTALTFGESGRLTIQAENDIRHGLFEIHDELVQAKRVSIRNPSIYWGDGFANALFKGMAKNVVVARDFVVDKVVPKLSGYNPATTTFIVCENQPYESEEIGREALSTFMTGTPPMWIQSWFPDFYRLGADAALTIDVQQQLISSHTTIQSLTEDFKREVLRPLLEGVLTDNSRIAVNALLPWFAEAEFFLKENWFPFLKAVTSLEGEPLKDAEFAIRKELELLRESLKEITLGDRLNMYLRALEKYEPASPLLAQKPQTAELTQIRNQFAHGLMLRDLPTKWKEVLGLLLWFEPQYEGVLKLIEQDGV
jgi:hypothetical protein